jgi:transposase
MLLTQDHVVAQEQVNKIIALTKPYPMTRRLAFKIYKAYGTTAVDQLTRNPYALARDVFGIGEDTAAKIAKVIESKLDKTFSPNVAVRAKAARHHYGGPGNGKLNAQSLESLKQKLRQPPVEALPAGWDLHNPSDWTLSDLKRAVKLWFNVSWAHDSSYRNLFKKCHFSYDRKKKIFVYSPK